MSAIAICFLSAKGGSGKTVTSSALGTFLAALGSRVLLVDTDAATNGMTLLYLNTLLATRRGVSAPGGAIGLFEARETEPPTPIAVLDRLDFVPASFRMSNTEQVELSHFKAALTSVVQESREAYDFIFLDAQAGADDYARQAAAAADEAVIVSEYDPVSAQGIERLKVLFQEVLRPDRTWTLYNKVLPEFASVIGEGLSVARYLPPLPWDADVVRAFARRDLAIDIGAPNPYTLAIAQVGYTLFPDETGTKIEDWRGTALRRVTTPIEQRLGELDTAQEVLERAGYKRRLLAYVSMGVLELMVIFSFVLAAAMAWEFLTSSDVSAVLFFAIIFLAMTISRAWAAHRSFRKGIQSGVAQGVISEERKKLQASLEAAKAALRLQAPGLYESRRRAS